MTVIIDQNRCLKYKKCQTYLISPISHCLVHLNVSFTLVHL